MKSSFFFLIFLLASNLSASYFFDSKNYCIEDYWTNGTTLYYQVSSTGNIKTTTTKNLVRYIYSGYEYDYDNDICRPLPAHALGMSLEAYNGAMAITALLFFSMTSAVIILMLVRKS